MALLLAVGSLGLSATPVRTEHPVSLAQAAAATQLSPDQFLEIFDNADLPAPAITGDVELDERIRAVGEQRGYTRRPLPKRLTLGKRFEPPRERPVSLSGSLRLIAAMSNKHPSTAGELKVAQGMRSTGRWLGWPRQGTRNTTPATQSTLPPPKVTSLLDEPKLTLGWLPTISPTPKPTAGYPATPRAANRQGRTLNPGSSSGSGTKT